MSDDIIKQMFEFIVAVIDMRHTQRDFYNGGASQDYLEMRSREKEVDYLTKELIKSLKSFAHED